MRDGHPSQHHYLADWLVHEADLAIFEGKLRELAGSKAIASISVTSSRLMAVVLLVATAVSSTNFMIGDPVKKLES